jgi:hypothetical protein
MLWRGAIVIVFAGAEMNSNFRSLSISKVKIFRIRLRARSIKTCG